MIGVATSRETVSMLGMLYMFSCGVRIDTRSFSFCPMARVVSNTRDSPLDGVCSVSVVPMKMLKVVKKVSPFGKQTESINQDATKTLRVNKAG